MVRREIAKQGKQLKIGRNKSLQTKQGHHHNVDQAARRPASICGGRFVTRWFGVRVGRA